MRQTLESGTPVTVATPRSGEPRRGIVVLPDIGGLGPTFDAIATDLAERCDAAVGVVELFPGRETLTFQERLDFGLRDISETAVLGDAVATAELLGAASTSVVGFCIGGALAMRATTTDRFDRVVAFYGMVHMPPPWAGDKGDPLSAVSAADTPVLDITGADDQFISAEDLDELEAAGATVMRVPGVQHGFVHDPDLAAHDADAAASAWSRAAEFLTAD